jgi:hypothetical protein
MAARIAQARNQAGNAPIGVSLTLRSWFARAAERSRYRASKRGCDARDVATDEWL